MKLQDVKMTGQMTGHENAGHEIAGHETCETQNSYLTAQLSTQIRPKN